MDKKKLKDILYKYFDELGPDYEIKIDKIIEYIDTDTFIEQELLEELFNYEEVSEENSNLLKKSIDKIYSNKIIPRRRGLVIIKKKIHDSDDSERINITEELEKQEEIEEIKRKERAEKLEKQEVAKSEESEKKKEKDSKRIIDLEVTKKYIKRTSQDEFIKTIAKNKTNNKYLENQYNRIIEIKKDIRDTKISIINLNSLDQKNKYETILNDLEREYEDLINSCINYINELNKINLAIENLKKPSESLSNEKKYIEDRRDFFNKYSEYLFITSGVFFTFFILFFYINYIIEFEFLKEKKIEFTIYFLAVFPIVFTALIGLVMVRQSNMKSKELIDINKRFILIDEINNSLKALIEIYRDKDISEKTEKIIDRLIINILNYTSSNINNQNDDKELLEANTKFDEAIDSLNKKLTFITDTIKNLKGTN